MAKFPRTALQGHGRDRGLLATTRLRRDIGKLEELAPAVRPARRFRDRAAQPLRSVDRVEAGVGVGLEDSAVSGQMLLGMNAGAIGRVEEHRRRRIGAPNGPSSRT
jgi:hypothetical protein